MEEKYFTVEQVSELLKMHPKTIQRYIREGKLRAVKFGKGWRVSGHDLSVFTEGTAASEPAEALESGGSAGCRATASSVVEISSVSKPQAERILSALTAALNSKPPEYGKCTMHAQYIESLRQVRVTLWGDVFVVEQMLASVGALIGGEE
ncbi:MAG TPA: helix-turn-helix domain-containing protein [Eubacteriales bacterium]|nr:helix-turn-helix domain-containing protein [Eubacteriales bacterium]